MRGGADNSEIFTTYSGTVPGDAMDAIIPSSSGDSFDVEWQVNDDGELTKATMEGVFYPQTDPMTYTVEFATTAAEGHHRPGPEVSGAAGQVEVSRTSRVLLAMAAVAVAFAAADTYVVVLALPDMMTGVGVPIDQLQRAAPIVSGFLLGYVAMLPLIGRIADLRGRVPVLVMALVLFALGSLITTLAYDMPSIVAGRFLQGVGGGGLVPATLALVADLYPVERRGIPLGVVSAVQEIGSVLGPLFGAAVLAVSDWRAIFAINLAVGLVLAAAIRALAPRPTGGRRAAGRAGSRHRRRPPPPRHLRRRRRRLPPTPGPDARPDVGPALHPLRRRRPLADTDRHDRGRRTPAAPRLVLVRTATAARPPGLVRVLVEADLVGALLLALALGGVILAFATADPKIEVFSPRGRWYLLGAVVAATAFVWHVRRAANPLVPRGALRRTPAWGALLVSFFVGAALIAALIDIPLFARTTVYPDDQLPAALVLVRFLLALPVGAVAGGYLIRFLSPGVVTAVGMLMAAAAFVLMTRWGLTTLEEPVANVALVVGGLGFGLALAPVNAALLAFTDDDVHGVATAFVVVSRMVGMLIGISALTTIGLRRYYAEQKVALLSRSSATAGAGARRSDLLRVAGIAQEHAVFWGPPGCAAVAAVLALGSCGPPQPVTAESHDHSWLGSEPWPTSTTSSTPTGSTPGTSSTPDSTASPTPASRWSRAWTRASIRCACWACPPATPRSSATPAGASRRRRSRRWCSASTARGRAHPRRPPHPLRDGHSHPGGAARAGGGRPARTPWQGLGVIADQRDALARRRRCAPTR